MKRNTLTEQQQQKSMFLFQNKSFIEMKNAFCFQLFETETYLKHAEYYRKNINKFLNT